MSRSWLSVNQRFWRVGATVFDLRHLLLFYFSHQRCCAHCLSKSSHRFIQREWEREVILRRVVNSTTLTHRRGPWLTMTSSFSAYDGSVPFPTFLTRFAESIYGSGLLERRLIVRKRETFLHFPPPPPFDPQISILPTEGFLFNFTSIMTFSIWNSLTSSLNENYSRAADRDFSSSQPTLFSSFPRWPFETSMLLWRCSISFLHNFFSLFLSSAFLYVTAPL